MLAETTALAVAEFLAILARLAYFFAFVREAIRRRHRLARRLAYLRRGERCAVHDGPALRFGHGNMRSHGRSCEMLVV